MKGTKNDWQRLSFAMTHRSLYVLGAGASLPTVPNRTADLIRKKIFQNGLFEVSGQPTSLLKERLLPFDTSFDASAFISGGVSQNELDSLVPASVVETFFAQLITQSKIQRTSQYSVFDHFYQSVLFNFNNDNLADKVHFRHLCLRPHGKIDRRLVHAPSVNHALRWLAVSDEFTKNLGYHRPLPEPGDITSRTPYQVLISNFLSMQAVVIIGYSFGEQPGTGSIDDSESFEMIVDLLRWRPKPVLLIDPFPERLVLRIEQAVRNKIVSPLQCKWNVLSEFILSGGFASAYKQSGQARDQEITSLYQKFEERM